MLLLVLLATVSVGLVRPSVASAVPDPSIVLEQLGLDLDGEAAGDVSGWSVAVSADGTTLAVGALRSYGAGDAAGQVRVYVWDGGAWVQQGTDLDGEATGDESGYSVALSADGTTLAIGAPDNDGAGGNAGHVRVYVWDGGAWVQQGTDLDGETTGDNSGYSVALSADGTTLAIGAPFNDGAGDSAGHVRVYVWDGGAWVQQGTDLDGEAAVDLSGASVALSADGTTLAIGARFNDGAGFSAGHVRVYVAGAAPVLAAVPADITAEATSASGATVAYPDPTATDVVDPNPTVACTPPSGTTFAIATTTVTCTATDDAGNSTAASFDVTVVDTTAPTLADVPADIDGVEATSPAGAVVTFPAPTASDTVDPDPDVTCDPPSGTTFPLGTTTVTCTATDAAGNTADSSFDVTVVDTTAPTLADVPADIDGVEATSPAGAVVTFPAPTATDVVDPAPDVTCTPASGTTFPLGTTTVTCTATDAAGNIADSSFDVTVVDTTAPTLVLPATLTDFEPVTADGDDGAVVDYPMPTSDDPDATITCDPPSGAVFPVGTTTVTCTATDAAGNSTVATFDVQVLAAALVTAELVAAGAAALLWATTAVFLLAAGAWLLRRTQAPNHT